MFLAKRCAIFQFYLKRYIEYNFCSNYGNKSRKKNNFFCIKLKALGEICTILFDNLSVMSR